MKNSEKKLRNMLHDADMDTVEQIAEQCPAAADAAKERIFSGILTRQTHNSAAEAAAQPVTVIHRRSHRSIWAAAACLLLCCGVIGGLSLIRPSMTEQQKPQEITNPAAEVTDETDRTSAELPKETQKAEHSAKPADPSTQETAPVQDATELVQMQQPAQTVTEAIPVEQQTVSTAVTETEAPPAQTSIAAEIKPAETTVTLADPEQNAYVFLENPTIEGFTLTAAESCDGWKAPHWCVTALKNNGTKQTIERRYAPSYLPQGLTPDDEHNRISNQKVEQMRRVNLSQFVYELKYHPPGSEDRSYPLTTSYFIMTQKTLPNGGFEFETDTQVAPITINGNSGFIARETLAPDFIPYRVCWAQDGYLFEVFVSDIPESYLPELIKMAESVAPIE